MTDLPTREQFAEKLLGMDDLIGIREEVNEDYSAALTRIEELEAEDSREYEHLRDKRDAAEARATAAEQELERRRKIVLDWLEEFKGTRDEFQDEACWAWLHSAGEGDGDATLG